MTLCPPSLLLTGRRWLRISHNPKTQSSTPSTATKSASMKILDWKSKKSRTPTRFSNNNTIPFRFCLSTTFSGRVKRFRPFCPRRRSKRARVMDAWNQMGLWARRETRRSDGCWRWLRGAASPRWRLSWPWIITTDLLRALVSRERSRGWASWRRWRASRLRRRWRRFKCRLC